MAAEAGMFVIHQSGDVRQLLARKDDDTGWWLTDKSGLSDYAMKDRWRVLDQEALAVLFPAKVKMPAKSRRIQHP